MRNPTRVFCWILLCLPLILLVGCRKAAPVTHLSLVINAAANVNPDAGGQALSVVVRVYQLKDKGRLESADYSALLRSDKETLSDDLLERQERIIQPGTQEMMELQTNPSAAYVGVVALFRSPSGDTWRRILPIAKGKTQKFTVALREQSVEVISAAK